MGEKRRPIFAAAKLEGSTGAGFARFARPRLARERMQARGDRGARGRKPPELSPNPRCTRRSALALVKTTRQSPVKRKTAKPATAIAAPSESVAALARERSM
jgi:hypothetical protein